MPKRILVVKLRTLGDILTTFPLLRAIKELCPGAQVAMVADESYAELFTANPRVDEFWGHPVRALKQHGQWYALRQHAAFIRRIRRWQPDLYIDLYGSLRTALWGALAGVPKRMGFNLRGRKYFYTQPIIASSRYVVDLNLQFARELGWQGQDNRLEFFLTREDQDAARQHLLSHGWDAARPLLVVSPGGGWPLKCWPAERFGAVAKGVADQTGCQVVLSGAPAEQALITACARVLGGPYIPAVGLPLRQVAAVIAQSRLFLGNDSGPKYFAEAFQVPTLICYGPTDFVNNNPAGSRRHEVAFMPVECRPCHSETCRQTQRVCLDDLPADAVLQQALRLWKG